MFNIILAIICLLLFHITLVITFILNPFLPKSETTYRMVKHYGYIHCLKSMFKSPKGYLYSIKDNTGHIIGYGVKEIK